MKQIRWIAAVTVFSLGILFSGEGMAEIGSGAPPPPTPTQLTLPVPPCLPALALGCLEP